jgi:O-antigen/teichoic acid export membrane protein
MIISIPIFQKIFSGDTRSKKAKKNIVLSFIIKGTGILISLLTVPLALNYLSSYEYGIWLTISSILTWINYMDIGLANGLRNRLTESFAADDWKAGKVYVSTTFYLLVIIVGACFGIFLLMQPFINWADILNIDPGMVKNLNTVIIFAFAFFSLSLVFKTAGIILVADQRPAINDLITLAGSGLSLLVLFILTKTTTGSLNYAVLTFAAVPALVFLISFPLILGGRYRRLKPSTGEVRFVYTRDLIGLGLQFFILQISSIVIFSSSNIIISRILGPEQVTAYNIVFKYFSMATLFFNIILTPMWSAATDAYAKGDTEWIRKAIRTMLKIWLFCVGGIFLMVVGSRTVYILWIGQAVKIPFTLTVLMAVYSVLILWSVCFSTFLSGLGKLKLQMMNIIVMAIIFIPLAIGLCKTLGIYGPLIALCLVNLSAAILNPVQVRMILAGRAKGIWFA